MRCFLSDVVAPVPIRISINAKAKVGRPRWGGEENGMTTQEQTTVPTACRLAPLAREDLGRTLAWRQDPALRAATIGHPFPVTEAEEAAWIEREMSGGPVPRTRVLFAIRPPTGQDLLGYVTLAPIDWIARTAEVGILVGAAADRGRGVGRTALSLLAAYAGGSLGLQRLYARIRADNAAAVALFRGQGYAHEGTLRRHAFIEGRHVNVALFGRLLDDGTAS
jgi:RimJ/RimL family protein N-acetyltransferase